MAFLVVYPMVVTNFMGVAAAVMLLVKESLETFCYLYSANLLSGLSRHADLRLLALNHAPTTCPMMCSPPLNRQLEDLRALVRNAPSTFPHPGLQVAVPMTDLAVQLTLRHILRTLRI